MNTKKIRKTLPDFIEKKSFYSKKELKEILDDSIQTIKNRKKELKGTDEADRWLSDNFDFILNISRKIKVKRFRIRVCFADFLYQAILSDDFTASKDGVQVLLNDVEKSFGLKEKELEFLQEAFLLSVIRGISYAIAEKSSMIPRLIRSLHFLNQMDFHRIGIQFSPLERTLRLDPAGIYPKMTPESKAMYREKIKKEAKRHKMSGESYAKKLLDRALQEKKHVGFYLKKEKTARFYFSAIIILALIVSLFPLLFAESITLAVLVFPLSYFFAKSIVDRIFSKIRKNEIIPSVRCDSVGTDEKTCVVIASLVNCENDIRRLMTKLKQYRLNNKDERDEIYFGLLCDFPQHKEEKNDNDNGLIRFLEKEWESFSAESNDIFVLIRSRVFHKSENAFVGWERKRGAIHEFIEFLHSGNLPNQYRFFGDRSVIGSKYLISLDADTELGIGQAKRLLGKMLHPLNKPVIHRRKDGVLFVREGYGILQPMVSPSLLNPISTPFAKIYSNGSGRIPYAKANFDTMQTLFGEGNFCGKGIIDVEAYHAVLKQIIPEQRILSHDMPEGALLRCGAVLDEYFLDSDPQDAISHDKRLHRWIRGDVQNVLLYRVLPKRRVLFAVENLLSYFVPAFQLSVLIISAFSPRKFAFWGCSLIIFYEFLPLVRELFAFLRGGNFQILGRRFQSKMRNRLLNSFYQCVLSLAGICHRAYNNADAILRSSYRLLISKKKLLEWQTYSPFSANKKDPLLYYLPSIFISIFLLFISNTPLLLFLALSFIFYPFVMLALSQPYVETDTLSAKEKADLLKKAKSEFLFYTKVVNESSSFLPPDNIQFEPVEKIANRTSPTNIGLYLASLVSAVDLGIISVQICLKSLEKAMDSIEKMEHFQGHLYNWYDLATLGVIGERFISTVDSGNYVASLVVVSSALKEWTGYETAKSLLARVEKEISSANFKALFDFERNLFYVGIFPDEKEKLVSHYDLYMSEARITSFYAIASRQIQPSHWFTTQRPLLSFLGRVGIGSWTGTCFEYFMPSLFLPMIDNSLEDESLNFAYFCQRKFYCTTEFGDLWGISESGYSLVDNAGNLQYMAFGVPFLSVQDQSNGRKVFSPYSTFLMLQKGGKDCLKNLEIFEKIGALGPMGYYEAVEFHSNFINDYKVVKSYMAHHKGMTFLSLASALNDGKNVKRFMSRSGFNETRELLAERFPIEGKIYRKKREVVENARKYTSANDSSYAFKSCATLGKILTDGKITLIACDDGSNRFLYHSKDLFKPATGGVRCRIACEGEEISFHGSDLQNYKMHYSTTGIEYIWAQGKKSAVLKFTPIFGKDAFLVRLELNGFPHNCRVEIEFDPLLMDEREYNAHPAFRDLSVELTCEESKLRLRRRGVEKHFDLKLFTPCKYKVKLGDSKEGNSFNNFMVFHSPIKMIFDFQSAENCVLPIFFNLNQGRDIAPEELCDGAYQLSKKICFQGERKMNHLNEICRTTKHSERILEEWMGMEDERQFYYSEIKNKNIDYLWKNGVSGDWSILAFYLDSLSRQKMKRLGEMISAFKKMMLSGFSKYDFVILRKAKEGYFDPERDALADLIREYQCEFLIGKHPGIHIVCGNEEDLPFWQSIASHFVSEQIPLKEQAAEKNFHVLYQNFENDKPKNVGTMLKNGFEIVKSNFDPKVPFSHVVSNGVAGFVCNQNSLGYTWYRNAGLNRISKWDNLPKRHDGEKIYLEVNGACYDLLQISDRVTYYDSLAHYQGKVLGREFSVIAMLPNKISTKIITVIFSKEFTDEAKLYYSFSPALGQLSNRNVLIERRENFAVLRPAIYNEYSDSAFVFVRDNNLCIYKNLDRLFFGCACKGENVFALGGFSCQNQFEFLKEQLTFRLEEMISECNYKVKKDTALQSPLKFWLNYQVLHSRFLGRTGLYQSSGAYGFRDQLQDSLAFLEVDPNRTKIHLIRCAAHQFKEGDVLHWWHPIRNQHRKDPGIRSRCSDDYLWLLYALEAYIGKTGDLEILDLRIPFLSGEELKAGEDEIYLNPERSETGTMREHLERGAKLFLSRGLGEHSLPFIGCGDWNDGMNQVDGESVWLAFFGAICLNRIKQYVSKPLAEEIDAFLIRMHDGIKASFNGVWFCRAFRKCGQILGNDITLESECSIDLITQAFSSFYFTEFYGKKCALEEDAVSSALRSAFEVLVDGKNNVVKLFEKPFVELSPSVGYIQKYCAGVRENGGQYTHAAVWFGMALLNFAKKTGNMQFFHMAKEIKEILDPTKNIQLDQFESYQREPYVLCGDVYHAKGYQGHGGWSWYTGAAGWYLQFLKEFHEFEKNETGIE